MQVNYSLQHDQTHAGHVKGLFYFLTKVNEKTKVLSGSLHQTVQLLRSSALSNKKVQLSAKLSTSSGRGNLYPTTPPSDKALPILLDSLKK